MADIIQLQGAVNAIKELVAHKEAQLVANKDGDPKFLARLAAHLKTAKDDLAGAQKNLDDAAKVAGVPAAPAAAPVAAAPAVKA